MYAAVRNFKKADGRKSVLSIPTRHVGRERKREGERQRRKNGDQRKAGG